jgi:RHS repeat-associated protein
MGYDTSPLEASCRAPGGARWERPEDGRVAPRHRVLRRNRVPHTPGFCVCGFRLNFMHNLAETSKAPTARESDTETGLYYYRARYYDQNLGRFLTEDPVGFDAGPHFYRYARNSPALFIDPTGLQQVKYEPPDPRDNTPVCDGHGGLRVQIGDPATLGGPKQQKCLIDCARVHEQSHIADDLAANPKVCKGKAAGVRLGYDPGFRAASEITASNAELDCCGRNTTKDAKTANRSSSIESEMWRLTVIVSRRNPRGYLIALVAVLVLAVPCGGSETPPWDIQVTLSNQRPLVLNVTVRSRSDDRVTLPKWRLPWGNRNSMLLVAVNDDGICIDNKYYVEEYPNYEKISIDPNGFVSGEIDLRRSIPELVEALKKSDIHLFWAYKAPEDLHIAHWSGGWLLIPRQK